MDPEIELAAARFEKAIWRARNACERVEANLGRGGMGEVAAMKEWNAAKLALSTAGHELQAAKRAASTHAHRDFQQRGFHRHGK
jgi:hypothetical protein